MVDSCTGDNITVIVAVNVLNVSELLLSVLPGISNMHSMQNNIGSKFSALIHLGQRGRLGHDARDGDIQTLSVVSHGKCMVAGRCTDHSSLSLLLREIEQSISCPTLFERPGELHEILFQVHFAATNL